MKKLHYLITATRCLDNDEKILVVDKILVVHIVINYVHCEY
jgi:hypothetical protein